MKIEKITHLPDEVNRLVEEATLDGHFFLKKMKEDWEQGTNCFNKPGEALFAVRDDSGQLVSLGGVNVDPYADDTRVGRIRHVYVSRRRQRSGLGKIIVSKILEHAALNFEVVRLRTHNPAAIPFYLALGFQQDLTQDDPTHTYFIKKLV